MKVFIVDDSEVVCERLTAMLSELPGIEIVGQAQDAAKAISSVRKLQPDAAILDIRLPASNGIEVFKTIKKGNSAPMTIILTNYPYDQYRKKCMEAGADFFFDKTTEFDRLTELFKKSIQGSDNSIV